MAIEIATKIPEYKHRGDLGIWSIHPNNRTPTSRRLELDGSYVETTYRGSVVRASAFPGVAIDLRALFDD